MRRLMLHVDDGAEKAETATGISAVEISAHSAIFARANLIDSSMSVFSNKL